MFLFLHQLGLGTPETAASTVILLIINRIWSILARAPSPPAPRPSLPLAPPPRGRVFSASSRRGTSVSPLHRTMGRDFLRHLHIYPEIGQSPPSSSQVFCHLRMPHFAVNAIHVLFILGRQVTDDPPIPPRRFSMMSCLYLDLWRDQFTRENIDRALASSRAHVSVHWTDYSESGPAATRPRGPTTRVFTYLSRTVNDSLNHCAAQTWWSVVRGRTVSQRDSTGEIPTT